MGFVHAEITLKNAVDEANAQRGIIKESEIRQTTLTAMVDTGAGTLVINEEIRQLLGLEIKAFRQAKLADGSLNKCGLTEPVCVQWKNRDTICQAMVLPNSSTVLLGAIPLEGMDLIINPVSQELTGAHGEEILHLIL